MKTAFKRALPLLVLLSPAAVLAQGLPTTQPPFLRVIREDVKPGRSAEHARHEMGWPAAFEKAGSTDYYLAMESLTNNEAWYVIPSASFAAMGEAMARERGPALAAEMDRLSKLDGDMLNGARTVWLRARPELSHGAYPDLGKQRFWEVTIFRMRPGGEPAFANVAKAYNDSAAKAGVSPVYRVYEVMAGMPAPTFFIFSSVASFAEFDKRFADGQATMQAWTDAEAGKKFDESLVNSESFRLRLSPEMSYVSKEVRAADADFWMPKKAMAAAKPAATKVAAAKPAAK
jgi:hypothetical protein